MARQSRRCTGTRPGYGRAAREEGPQRAAVPFSGPSRLRSAEDTSWHVRLTRRSASLDFRRRPASSRPRSRSGPRRLERSPTAPIGRATRGFAADPVVPDWRSRWCRALAATDALVARVQASSPTAAVCARRRARVRRRRPTPRRRSGAAAREPGGVHRLHSRATARARPRSRTGRAGTPRGRRPRPARSGAVDRDVTERPARGTAPPAGPGDRSAAARLRRVWLRDPPHDAARFGSGPTWDTTGKTPRNERTMCGGCHPHAE